MSDINEKDLTTTVGADESLLVSMAEGDEAQVVTLMILIFQRKY